MAVSNFNDTLNNFFQKEEWEAARKLLKKELDNSPDDHWVLTQLATTFYEQRHYAEALPLLLQSIKIVPDCPLTLWHLAGTLDALGKPTEAISIYLWLLRNKVSPAADPCWESEEWKAALQADCMFSLGVSYQKLHKKKAAEWWFRQYLDMLLLGVAGTYSFADVQQHLQELRNGSVKRDLRKSVDAALQAANAPKINGRGSATSRRNISELVAKIAGTQSG